MTRVWIGLGEHRVEAGHARIRDEPLTAVQDVLVAVPPSLGPHRCRVGARTRLRERVGPEPLAAREAREPPVALHVGARELDRERAEFLDGEDKPGRRADLRDLLDRDEEHEHAGAGAAVALLERKAQQLVLAEELDHVPRELGGGVDLGRARCDPLAREGANERADLALIVRKRVGAHVPQCRLSPRKGGRMRRCSGCGGKVESSFRFCPWCAAPQRRKLTEFFAPHPEIEGDQGRALRVSRYLAPDALRHVRFSIWGSGSAGSARRGCRFAG